MSIWDVEGFQVLENGQVRILDEETVCKREAVERIIQIAEDDGRFEFLNEETGA